jgi:hypothetical protein
VAGGAAFQLTVTISIIGNQSLRMKSIDIGGRCSFSINQLVPCNWKSIAPHEINRYWRAMQVAKLPKHGVQFDSQIAHLNQ